MSEVTFFIYNKKYVYLSYYASDGRVRAAIGETCDKSDWDNGNVPKPLSRKITRLTNAINTFVDKYDIAGKRVYKSDILNILAEQDIKASKGKTDTLGDAFKEYTKLIEEGKLLNKGKNYSKATTNHLKAMQQHFGIDEEQRLKNTCDIAHKRLNDFTRLDFEAYKKYLIGQGATQNTVSIYVAYLKSFFKRTYVNKLNWHSNNVFLDGDITVPPEDIDHHVYLSEAELQQLLEIDMDPVRNETRDCFVFGCYTGLRFSDLQVLKPVHVRNGVLHKNTQKKGVTVMIPLNALAQSIWDKYKGELPVRHRAPFEKYIREVCQEAAKKYPSFKEEILFTRTEQGVKIETHKPKHQMVGPHTMRRSFATNAYLAGVPTLSIRKITGHKTEQSFLKYIRMSNQENAVLMQQHPFFK